MSGAEEQAGSAGTLHLDTNVLIAMASADTHLHQQVAEWSRQHRQFAASTMAWAEYCCGPVSARAREAWAAALDGQLLAVTPAIAEHAAQLFCDTGRRSRSLPDCLIAATALAYGAPLATFNRQDFAPFISHGLELA